MTVVRSIAAILCFLLPAAARATTYEYTGSTYTFYGAGALPEDFGTHMTATVTTVGDTTDASGKFTYVFSVGTISSIQITSGPLVSTGDGTGNAIGNGSYVILDHGAISEWVLFSFLGTLNCGSGGSAYVHPCVMQTANATNTSFPTGEYIQQVCQLCGPTSEKGNNQFVAPGAFGTWAIVEPVPAPVFGSGIGGLALLISFFISRSAKHFRHTRRGRYWYCRLST